MTMQAVETPGIEQRLSALEARIAALEAVMTLFIEEQREYRREVNARFEKIEQDIHSQFDKMDARFDKVDASIERAREGTNRLMYAVLGIVGALAVAVIVSNVFS